MISHIHAASYPPPGGIHLATVDDGLLLFEWISISAACTSVLYSITSNCGVCPHNTNLTIASCFDLQLSTSPTVCTFAIASVVCGNIFGTPSDPISITLKGIASHTIVKP